MAKYLLTIMNTGFMDSDPESPELSTKGLAQLQKQFKGAMPAKFLAFTKVSVSADDAQDKGDVHVFVDVQFLVECKDEQVAWCLSPPAELLSAAVDAIKAEMNGSIELDEIWEPQDVDSDVEQLAAA